MPTLTFPERKEGRNALPALEFTLTEEKSSLIKSRKRRLLSTPTRTAHRTAPFASIGMASAPNAKQSKSSPVFIIASASEKSALPATTGAPRWRVAAGNLAAGATAGCAVEAALYPIDTIKTRLQAMRSGGGFRALLQAGGGRALYAGVWGNLAGVAPASAIFMAVYEPVKQAVIAAVPPEQNFLGPLAAGVAAGVASSVVRVPTEVIKTRMQTGEFKNALTALRTVAAREGARGLFAGYGSFLLRDLPFDAIEFVAYEQLKRSYKTSVLNDSRELNPGEHSVFGAAAGAITGFVTTPLDVLKTRLMIQGASGQYRNVVDCASQIVKQEGAGALLRGWQPRVIWIGVGGSIFFTVLEASKKFYAPKPPVKPCCAGKNKKKEGK
jgi:solute carrier family 25 (mitochondrial S-adenosylmethionine transporter), member 26